MAKLLLDESCNVTVIHSKTSEEDKRKFNEVFLNEGSDILTYFDVKITINKNVKGKQTCLQALFLD